MRILNTVRCSALIKAFFYPFMFLLLCTVATFWLGIIDSASIWWRLATAAAGFITVAVLAGIAGANALEGVRRSHFIYFLGLCVLGSICSAALLANGAFEPLHGVHLLFGASTTVPVFMVVFTIAWIFGGIMRRQQNV
jgi:hypothetical protein